MINELKEYLQRKEEKKMREITIDEILDKLQSDPEKYGFIDPKKKENEERLQQRKLKRSEYDLAKKELEEMEQTHPTKRKELEDAIKLIKTQNTKMLIDARKAAFDYGKKHSELIKRVDTISAWLRYKLPKELKDLKEKMEGVSTNLNTQKPKTLAHIQGKSKDIFGRLTPQTLHWMKNTKSLELLKMRMKTLTDKFETFTLEPEVPEDKIKEFVLELNSIHQDIAREARRNTPNQEEEKEIQERKAILSKIWEKTHSGSLGVAYTKDIQKAEEESALAMLKKDKFIDMSTEMGKSKTPGTH